MSLSVADQTPYNEYTGNGVATAYGFEFEITVAAQLKVKVDGALVSSADYTVSGEGVQAGGTVTFDTAPADDAEILIYRDTALERTIGYTTNGPFPATTVNKDFNYLWMVLQEILAGLRVAARVLRFPFGDERNAELPAASARANKALIFDAEGDVTVSEDDYEDQAAAAAASAAAAAASAVSSSNSAGASATSAIAAGVAEANAEAALAAAQLIASGSLVSRQEFTGSGPYTVTAPGAVSIVGVLINGKRERLSKFSIVGLTATNSTVPYISTTAEVDVEYVTA